MKRKGFKEDNIMKEVKTITWSSKQLAAMFNKGTIKFDSYVQRNKCWDNKRKSLLVRTVLNGFPRVPEIYATRESDSKVYQCLDGQQRLTTMFDFMNDEIVLDELEPVIDDDGNVYELTGKKFSDLDEILQDIILTYSWRVAYYDDLDDDEIAELFYLINNSKPLSQIEHVRCISPSLKTIQEIGKHELFTTALTEKAFEKYTHEDLVMKSYIMLTSDTPSLDNKFVRPIMETAVFTKNNIDNLNAIYNRIINTYKTIISDTSEETSKLSKRIAKRLLTRTHMLSIIPIVKRSLDENVSDEMFTNWVKNFFCGTKSATKYEAYNCRCTSGSGHADNIKVRLETIQKDYEEFMKQYEKEDRKEDAKETSEAVTDVEDTDIDMDTATEVKTVTETENETNENNTDAATPDSLRTEINAVIKSMTPVQKTEMKKKLTEAGLPTAFKTVTDVEVLKTVLSIVKH